MTEPAVVIDLGEGYAPDRSLKGKVRRRLTRLQHRRPASRISGAPMVTFSFDDAPASAFEVGAPILEARGVRGTFFVACGLAGRVGRAGLYAEADAMRRAHAAGHEIACHTFAHMDCGQAGAETIQADLDRNRKRLEAWGLPAPRTFAYPFGDVSAQAKREIDRRFALSRGVHRGLIRPGADLNQAPAVGVEGVGGEALARAWLARLAAQGGWLILFTHGVTPSPEPFGASADGLARLVDEALARGFEPVTAAEGARRFGAEVQGA